MLDVRLGTTREATTKTVNINQRRVVAFTMRFAQTLLKHVKSISVTLFWSIFAKPSVACLKVSSDAITSELIVLKRTDLSQNFAFRHMVVVVSCF